MTPEHRSSPTHRPVSASRIVLGTAVTLALLLLFTNVFGVGAAPLEKRKPGGGGPNNCPTSSTLEATASASQPTSVAEGDVQNVIGFAVVAATTGTAPISTTAVPRGPGRPLQACHPGDPEHTTGTPAATGERPEHPRPTADPNQTPGTDPQAPGGPEHRGPGHQPPPDDNGPRPPQQTAEPEQTSDPEQATHQPGRGRRPPQQTAEPEQTSGPDQATRQPGGPRPHPRPPAGSGYPDPGQP